MNGASYLKLNLKNKITAGLALWLAIILSLIYFIVLPTIKEIKTIGRTIEAEREDLEKKYIKGQSLKRLTENLNKIEPKLKLLDQVFINKNRELEFITSLESEANKSRVSQRINLSAPPKQENQNFQKADLKLFTKGGFLNQLEYLLSLEHLSYYINVKLLELSPAGGEQIKNADQAAGELNMYLQAATYWN